MSGRNTVLWVSLVAVAMFAALAVTKAQTGGNSDAVAAVTKLENDSVKADLANDKPFSRKFSPTIGPEVTVQAPGSRKLRY